MSKKIVMVAGKGSSTYKVFNALKKEFTIDKLIIEDSPGTKKFLLRRAKRLGYFKVFGQVLFQATVQKLLGVVASKRLSEIAAHYNFDMSPPLAEELIEVPSINANSSLELLNELNPDIIVVNGTRIISKKILNGVDATFLNTHAGITPKYRGCHGGYWSLANNDRKHCGVTTHLVDPGIDTGGVLYQALIKPTKKDNFITYTHLQLGEGLKLMKKAINDALSNKLQTVAPMTDESILWHHPTIWYYLYHRIFNGVK